jgi:hypothetical protein
MRNAIQFIAGGIMSILFIVQTTTIQVNAQFPNNFFKATGSPSNPKVRVSWNRYNDADGLYQICKNIVEAYPGLAKLYSIGKSFKGNDLWCLTITDFSEGNPDAKPAIYLQGNIHGNEIQGSEYLLYTAWYLTENFADVNYIQKLLADKVFYIVPSVNPDARDHFIHELNTEGSSRDGFSQIFDFDRDGKVNEDDYDDIDGDGEICSMRVKDSLGTFYVHPHDPMSVIQLPEDSIITDENGTRAKYPSAKNYRYYPREGGIDNDSDGLTDEDGWKSFRERDYGGHYIDMMDLNRNWGWSRDTSDYNGPELQWAFSHPETKAIKDFFLRHVNITIAQSFHNNGGLLFPGTSSKRLQNSDRIHDHISQEDLIIYDILGIKGEQMLPGYFYGKSMNNLSLPGREIDWMFGYRGAYSFINELFSNESFYHKRGVPYKDYYLQYQPQKEIDSVMKRNDKDNFEYVSFLKEFLFNDCYIEWHKVIHPVLGEVEIGGYKRNWLRLTPGFLMEAEAHRNMAFTIYFASQMPEISFKNFRIQETKPNLFEVSITIANSGLLPTHSGPDIKHNIIRPDFVTIKCLSAKVIEAYIKNNANSGERKLPGVKMTSQAYRCEIDNISGKSELTIRWIIKGTGNLEIIFDGIRAGVKTFGSRMK